MSCSLSRVTCHVSARHIFTWRASPTNCGHPSARRQFPQQRNSSQHQRICSGCAVVQAPHHLFRFSQPSSTCCHVLAKLQRIGSAETYIWVLKLYSCKTTRYPSTSCTCTSESMAPSCRSMTFSAPLCCSVVQDTRAVHPHTTTTTTTAMIPALCASCRGKGWRLFSPLALTLAESWCTLHAGSWYF